MSTGKRSTTSDNNDDDGFYGHGPYGIYHPVKLSAFGGGGGGGGSGRGGINDHKTTMTATTTKNISTLVWDLFFDKSDLK